MKSFKVNVKNVFVENFEKRVGVTDGAGPSLVLVLWVHLIEACRLRIRITLSKLIDWLAIIVWQLLLLVVLDWHLPTRVHWIFPSIWLWLALMRYKHLLRIAMRVLLLESLGWAHTRHFC